MAEEARGATRSQAVDLALCAISGGGGGVEVGWAFVLEFALSSLFVSSFLSLSIAFGRIHCISRPDVPVAFLFQLLGCS